MKILLMISILLTSLTLSAQNRFHVPTDKSLIRNYKNTQDNHLIILRTYHNQIESEIRRLIEGIEYESSSNNISKVTALKKYFSELVIKNILIGQLEKQLLSINLDTHLKQNRIKPVFNTDQLSIDLQKEINIQLKSLHQNGLLSEFLLEELKDEIIKETLKATGKKVFSSIGSGLLTKIVTQGVSTAALKSAVISIGSEAFIQAGQGMIITILTLPLHAYRLPPEHVWTDILKKNPEIIINPEWMKYAGSNDDPWLSHGYALLRRTKIMEDRLTDLLDNEEHDFLNQIQTICKIGQVSGSKDPLRSRNNVAVADATYVYRHKPYLPSVPFWALKK